MQQYVISPVIGTGTDADPIRLNATDQIAGGSSTSIIPSSPTTGLPLFAWGICMVDAVDLTTVVNDTTNHPLPQITLDALWSTVSHAIQTAVQSEMTTLGISTTFINHQTTMRQIVNAIGQFLDTHFDANNFSA